VTFLSEHNEDAMSVDPQDGALGPRVGFQENFGYAWEAQNKAAATHGIQETFREIEQDQVDILRRAGVEDVPEISPYAQGAFSGLEIGPVYGTRSYLDVARFYAEGGDENSASYLAAFDERIEGLRKRYPDLQLKSSRDMFDEVVKVSREAEEKAANARTTMGGKIGGFAGGTAASLNPRTSPFNFMTLPAGGVGKTAGAQILTQAAGQGGIEAINQITGVQEQRELLGLENGFMDGVSRVAGAAVGGAVVQGLGEGVALAGKRFFKSSEGDIAPPPPAEPQRLLEYKPGRPQEGGESWPGQHAWESDVKAYQEQTVRDLMTGTRAYTDELQPMSPLSNTRQGKARTAMDIDYVAPRLEAWDGETPNLIPPRTMTAIPKKVDAFVSPEIKVDIHSPGKNIDDAARQIDPKLFKTFDELAANKTVWRRWLDEMKPDSAKVEAKLDEINTKISNLQHNMSKVGNKKRAALEPKLEELKAEQAKVKATLLGKDSPEMATVRGKLLDADQRMRDMAPEVTRAYAFAKKQWDLGAEDREAIRSMIRDGRSDFPNAGKAVLNDTYENTVALFDRTLVEKAPILQQAEKVQAKMSPSSDAADYAKAIIADNMKTLDDALEVYRSSIDKLIKEEGGEIQINGQKYKLSLDKDAIAMPHDEGTGGKMMSIRQILEDQSETEFELKAVQTCSISKAS